MTGTYTNREGQVTALRELRRSTLLPGFWTGQTAAGAQWRVHEHRLVLDPEPVEKDGGAAAPPCRDNTNPS